MANECTQELQRIWERFQRSMIAAAEAIRPAFRAFRVAYRITMSNRRIRRAWRSGRVDRATWLIEDRRRRIMESVDYD